MSRPKGLTWIHTSGVANTLVVWGLASIIVVYLANRVRLYEDPSFWPSFAAGVHNTLVDMLIIGVLIFWLNKKSEDRLRIQMYMEEIDIWRTDGSDGTVRKNQLGLRRLNESGVHQIDLSRTTLSRSNLSKIVLRRSDLSNANCFETIFEDADLREVNFGQASLKHSSLRRARLDGARFINTNLTYADLTNASLRGADFSSANIANVVWDGAIYDATTRFPEQLDTSDLVLENSRPNGLAWLKAKLRRLFG